MIADNHFSYFSTLGLLSESMKTMEVLTFFSWTLEAVSSRPLPYEAMDVYPNVRDISDITKVLLNGGKSNKVQKCVYFLGEFLTKKS